jgi:CIC family chloride channel protein
MSPLSSMLTLLLKARLYLRRIFRLSESHSIFIWAAVAGVAGALATLAFRECIALAEVALAGHSGSLVEMARSLPWYVRLSLPALGGLVAGAVLVWADRFASKDPSDYMEAVAIGDGRIPVRHTLMRSISSLCTIASGGSIGREGSMVQLSALCASGIGRFARFDTSRLRLLVACGAAAGITSAYNTPLAGAIFVTEIVLGAIVMESFGPVVVASVVANITMRSFPGYRPTYELPPIPDVSGLETVLFILLGIVAGLAAPRFLSVLSFAKSRFTTMRVALPWRLGLGGLLVGLISIEVPQVWGNGYSVVNSLLHEQWVWSAVVLVLLAKVVATALTTGSGAVGGVFTPTLFVGAALGWLFGHAAHALLPEVAMAMPAYAIVGMGAFLAGTTYAPLMAIMMIFEMTLNYQVVLPLILACIAAYLVARATGKRSMYQVTIHRHREAENRLRLQGLHMRELMRPADTVLPLEASVDEMARMFLEYPVKYVYVVDASSRLQGVVALQDVPSALFNRQEQDSRTAAEFMRRGFLHTITPEMSLSQALELFLLHQGERLPVIRSEVDPELLGVVYKTALLDACFRLARPELMAI